MKKTPPSLALAALVASAFAQTTAPDEPIATIRPRVTDTTHLVPFGRFQLEVGFDHGYGGLNLVRRDDYGLAVLRYGAGQRVELRLEAPTYSTYRVPFQDGFGNTSFSAVALLGKIGPAWFTVQPRLTFPTAVERRRADEVAPSLFFTGEAEVANVWVFASTVGALHEKFNEKTFDVLRATFCVERYVDSRASAFVEYVGTYLNNSDPGHVANLGVRLRIAQASQVDLHWSLPISDDFTPRGVGIGYAVRF